MIVPERRALKAKVESNMSSKTVMNRMSGFFEFCRWAKSFGVKLFRTVPKYTASIVFMSLISQCSQILASLLPLKVILIMGAEKIPAYFPAFMQDYDKNSLVVWLSFVSGFFYILFLSSQRLITFLSDRGSMRILKKNAKTVVFHNQEQLAASAYLRYSRGISGFVFAVLGYLAVGVFYPEVAKYILIYLLFIFLSYLVVLIRFPSLIESMRKNLHGMSSFLSAIGFLMVFVVMVFDFLSGALPNVIIAAIMLLLSRIWFNKLFGAIVDITSLFFQRAQVDTLFFHARPLAHSVAHDESELWDLLELPQRNQWLEEVLVPLTKTEGDRDSKWLDIGIPNIAALNAFGKDESTNEAFLVKIYPEDQLVSANAEMDLISLVDSKFPAPRLLNAEKVGKSLIVIYSFDGFDSIEAEKAWGCQFELKKKLLASRPPESLIKTYLRSKQIISQRLNHRILSNLKTVCNATTDAVEVQFFDDHLLDFKKILDSLPLVVQNPSMNAKTIFANDEQDLIAVHWGGWSFEPFGAGWSLGAKELDQLKIYLNELQDVDADLSGVAYEHAAIAAHAVVFEQSYRLGKFKEAVSQIIAMNKLFKNLSV